MSAHTIQKKRNEWFCCISNPGNSISTFISKLSNTNEINTAKKFRNRRNISITSNTKKKERNLSHILSLVDSRRVFHRTVKIIACKKGSLANIAMASTSSALTISSSSTLLDGKAPRQSPAASPQCVSLPSPLLHSQNCSWKTTAYCKSLTKHFKVLTHAL